MSGLIVVTGIMQAAMNNRASVLPQQNTEQYIEMQTRNISMGLVDKAIEELKYNNEWEGTLAEDKYPKGGTGMLKTYDMNSQTFPTDMGNVVWDQYKVLLYSESTYDGFTLATEVLMQKDSFSKYSYYSNSELSTTGSTIWFWDQDELSGPIHTNGTFKMSGSPTFNGLVTSPNMWGAHPSNPTSPNFNGGTNFNAPLKSPPNTYELNRLKSLAAGGGLKFDRRIQIELFTQTVGTEVKQFANIRQTNAAETYWESWNTYDLSATNGVISTPRRVDIVGEVVGQLTVHSEIKIEIDGDIRYHTDPRVDSTSTDILGLVSEGDIQLDRYAHSYEGSQDVDIQATIMALNDSFFVEDWGSGSSRGNLNLLGGIIQAHRGAVGTFSGGSIRSGYQKVYEYDTRLKAKVPPAFPRESVFSVVYWNDKPLKKANSSSNGE